MTSFITNQKYNTMEKNSTQKNCLLKVKTITAFLFVIMLMCPFSARSQTVLQYADYDIATLMSDLNSGAADIYELTTSGGNYPFAGSANPLITLNKNVIIRAQAGLAARPKITINGTSTNSTAGCFMPNVPSMTLTLDGIEFDGHNNEVPTYTIYWLVRTATGTTATQDFKLVVRNCFFYNFGEASTNKGIFRMEGINSSVDIQGSTFNNCVGRLVSLQSVAVDPYVQYGDILLKNNTFCNIPNEGYNGNGIVTFRSASSGTQLAIGNNFTADHCTFYNCKFYPGSDVFVFRRMNGLISVTNCIFDQVSNGLTFVNPVTTAPAPVTDYNYLAGFGTPPAGTHTITTAPVYTNAATLNFALTNRDQLVGSDAMTAGNTMYYGVPTAISDLFMMKNSGKINIKVFPNPVSDMLRVEYGITGNSRVKLDIYSADGKIVKSLINDEPTLTGTYSKSFNISGLKPGVYFARLTAGRYSKTIKVLIER